MKLSIVLSSFVKNCPEILMGISLNLEIAFDQMALFTMLILLKPRTMETSKNL